MSLAAWYGRLARLSGVLVMVLAAAAAGSQLAAAPARAAVDIAPTDPNIKYVGRWDTSDSTTYVPSWAGGHLVVGFTGTSVQIEQRNAANFYVSIDGGDDVFYLGASGTVNLTPTPLASGPHTLRVAYRSGDTVFQGLVLDDGAQTFDPGLSSDLIEFVGDSITLGFSDSKLTLSSYGWLIGEQLGVRRTVIARSGYCLVGQDGCVGQSTQFFELGSQGDTDWDFSRYQASAVVINLGTNDIGHSVTGETFQSTYTSFIRNIRAVYPDAAIFALETLKRRYVPETQAAVQTVNEGGDSNVYYVSTEGVLTVGDDYTDGDGHPNDQGQQKLADYLAPIIAEHL